MENVLRIVFDVTVLFLIPVILIVSLLLTRRAQHRHDPAAARAGFWAGFVLFLIAMIYQVGFLLSTGFPDKPIYQGFSLPLALFGGVFGFIVFAGGRHIVPHKLIGLIVMIVTFVNMYALLHYVFIRSYNEILLSLILGVTFGVLAHFASSPDSLRKLLR